MAKQTRLEEEAIETRKNTVLKSDYYNGNEYSAEHKDAQSEGNGKGTGNASTPYLVLGENKSKTNIIPTINTEKGGSKDDIRERNAYGVINLYNKENQYGADIIDMSKNEGQIQLR